MLIDQYQRQFRYLRFSVTDVCNFRCQYCLPDGYKAPAAAQADVLTLPEIRNLFHGFAALGMEKIRVTGGEPTVRPDILDIIACAAETPGIRTVGMTTNGYRLKKMLPDLRRAGLTRLNVSIDSLNPETFAHVTGRSLLNPIREAVEEALSFGFERVKVNAVLLRSSLGEELDRFMAWIREFPISVRFIELMETSGAQKYFDANHVKASDLVQRLLDAGFSPAPRRSNDGPAIEYFHPNFRGSIGIIAPYSKDFCTSCNRLRVTSRGELRLCLFGTENHSIREFLQDPGQQEDLHAAVMRLLRIKTDGHRLAVRDSGSTSSLSMMGG